MKRSCPTCGCQMYSDSGPCAGNDLLEALREIAKGEGRFNRDPLEHAANTIEDMKAIAERAIVKAEGK